jgi:hypothetical protein
MEEYHQLSDAYMDALVSKLEQLQEQREDVDVEFSVTISPSPSQSPASHLPPAISPPLPLLLPLPSFF